MSDSLTPHGLYGLYSLEILQDRILEWVAFPFSRESSQPWDSTQVSHIVSDSLPTESQRNPLLSPSLHEMFPSCLLISLKRSLVFSILLFFSISLHCSLKKTFLSPLALLWNIAFSWVCLSLSPLSFASLLFSAICQASSDNHFTFLHFFFLGMVLFITSCTVLQTSVHSSSGTLSDLIPWIYSSPPLYNHKGFDAGKDWRWEKKGTTEDEMVGWHHWLSGHEFE